SHQAFRGPGSIGGKLRRLLAGEFFSEGVDWWGRARAAYRHRRFSAWPLPWARVLPLHRPPLGRSPVCLFWLPWPPLAAPSWRVAPPCSWRAPSFLLAAFLPALGALAPRSLRPPPHRRPLATRPMAVRCNGTIVAHRPQASGAAG